MSLMFYLPLGNENFLDGCVRWGCSADKAAPGEEDVQVSPCASSHASALSFRNEEHFKCGMRRGGAGLLCKLCPRNRKNNSSRQAVPGKDVWHPSNSTEKPR